MTRLLVTGGRGQLGRGLVRRAAARGIEVVALDLEQLDICDGTATVAQLSHARPDFVINAAAYTAVDKAESEPDRAFASNAEGAATLAQCCAARSIPLLHVSTDYVFDGTTRRPYTEDDPVAPLGVYGQSKAAGEVAVRGAGGTVVRTSWLFEEQGPSFVHAILRLGRERSVLRVVDDQYGCPTWADDLADALIELAHVPARAPTYHYCNDGVTTWHAFATAIVSEARRHRDIACERIEPIATSEYPTAARRPASSVLDTTRIRSLGITPPSWRPGLAHVVARILER